MRIEQHSCVGAMGPDCALGCLDMSHNTMIIPNGWRRTIAEEGWCCGGCKQGRLLRRPAVQQEVPLAILHLPSLPGNVGCNEESEQQLMVLQEASLDSSMQMAGEELDDAEKPSWKVPSWASLLNAVLEDALEAGQAAHVHRAEHGQICDAEVQDRPA